MSKVQNFSITQTFTKDYSPVLSDRPISAPFLLDTLAQLATPAPDKGLRGGKSVLLKRARSKYITNNITLKLADLDNARKKSYYNTFHCCRQMVQQGKKVTSKYCNNRWCLTCNRIRTAKLVNGYMKPLLQEMEDKYFVTLTIPNVPAEMLSETLDTMHSTFRAIMKTFEKQEKRSVGIKKRLVGIRKLETTFNPAAGTFHPHYHNVVEGKETAEALVDEWLKRYPDANRAAQNVKPADAGSVMELFKYFTKIATNKVVHIQALDTIIAAMRGRRVFQAMGIKKNVSEDIEELRSQIYADLEEREAFWTWIEGGSDWVDGSTGEMLTGYVPSANVIRITENTC